MVELILLFAIAGLMQSVGSFTHGATSGGTELAFGYLLLVAFLAGRVVSRLRLPKLTGYLLAGVVSGPFVLGLVTPWMTSSLRIVSDVATCILGLTAGGELELHRVRPLARTLRAITVLAIVPAMVILAALLFVMRPWLPMFAHLTVVQSLAAAGVIGVALAAQSPSVAMALLSETRAEGPLSRLVLATVVVADLFVVVVYSIAASAAGAVIGGTIDVVATVISVSWEVFGSLLFGVLIGAIIGAFLKHVRGGASMFALLICVIVAEIGKRVFLDPLVVMLAAGLWLQNFARVDAHALLRGFESAELPVFLVFFALSGSRLDLPQLWATILPVSIIALVRAGVFYAGSRLACSFTKADDVVTQYAWTGLVPQAGLSLALVVLVRGEFPQFGPAASVLLLSVVAVNQLIAPILLRLSLVKSGEAGKRRIDTFAGEHPPSTGTGRGATSGS